MKTDCELIEDFWVSQGGKPHMAADLWFYESSWDMLMPVVGKCYANGHFKKQDHAQGIRKAIIGYGHHDELSFKEVYTEVVKFIKWYNENQKS